MKKKIVFLKEEKTKWKRKNDGEKAIKRNGKKEKKNLPVIELL